MDCRGYRRTHRFHTLLLVKLVGPQGRVFAFEPMAENFQVLQENVALNGYEDVVPPEEGGHGSLLPGDDGPEQ
jgi:tRNA A58 N-methylase Trm61